MIELLSDHKFYNIFIWWLNVESYIYIYIYIYKEINVSKNKIIKVNHLKSKMY